MKAVIYTRCENNERPHDSIKQQLIDCEEYAEENELEIVDHYIDIAPGCMERGRRAGLELLLEDSKNKLLISLSLRRCRVYRIATLKWSCV